MMITRGGFMQVKRFWVPALSGLTLLALAAPSLAISQAVKIGDANSDDTVNVSDATVVLRQAIGLSNAPKTPFLDLRTEVLSDANQDGKVNVSDATMVLRASVGLGTLPSIQ